MERRDGGLCGLKMQNEKQCIIWRNGDREWEMGGTAQDSGLNWLQEPTLLITPGFCFILEFSSHTLFSVFWQMNLSQIIPT